MKHHESNAFSKFFFPLSELQSSFPFPILHYSFSFPHPNKIHMEGLLNRFSFSVASFAVIIVAAALVSSALCLAAEFVKSKKNDLRLDGKLCSLPRSAAVELGIAALICLSIAQVIGTLFICREFWSRKQGSASEVRKPTVSCSLLVFSWIIFGIAVALISGATSMSRSQPFGEGWLDGECYLVKDGVYIGSAVLASLALGSALGSGILAAARTKADENVRVHAQVNK